MTQDKLKRANELSNTIEQCKQAIAYLDASGAVLRCRYTSPSTVTTTENVRTFEGWYTLPINEAAQRILSDYYKRILEKSQAEFDNL